MWAAKISTKIPAQISAQILAPIRHNALFYALGLIIVLAVKYYYSRAGVPELAWILAPTAWWVGVLSGLEFVLDMAVGYVNHQVRFIIAPSCSGVQFLLVLFATLLFSFMQRLRSRGAACGWLVFSLVFAYLATVLVNAVRIVLAIHLSQLSLSNGWLTPERLHTLIGIVVYFAALLIIYRLVGPIIKHISRIPVANGSAAPAQSLPRSFRQTLHYSLTPLFWYFFIVLGLPFLNQLRQEGSGKAFLEYALLIMAVCGGIMLLNAVPALARVVMKRGGHS